MTQPEWQEFKKALDAIKPIPGFNSQRWLRKVRTQIYRESLEMTPEQISEREQQTGEQCARHGDAEKGEP
jgi:hypothetical protein